MGTSTVGSSEVRRGPHISLHPPALILIYAGYHAEHAGAQASVDQQAQGRGQGLFEAQHGHELGRPGLLGVRVAISSGHACTGAEVGDRKAARYFDVEEKYVFCTEERYVIDPEEAVKLVDENTIGICTIL